MENINNHKNIYDLIKSDGGAKIFNYYGIETTTKQNQKNPFAPKANKKKTSVFLTNFGMYYFKEWNTGIEGTALDFIQEYEGLDKYQAIEKVKNIYGDIYSFAPKSIKKYTKTESSLTILEPSALRLTDVHQWNSPFHQYFQQKFKIPFTHFQRWGIGSTTEKVTCFALTDLTQKIINLKYVHYLNNGKRDKNKSAYSLPKTKDRWGNETGKYKMCLFGEHLLTSEKNIPVVIVESEKTAFLASYFYPQYEWLAASSASGITQERLKPLLPILQHKKIYWLCDADEAGRKASSIQCLKEAQLNVQVIDLFPEFGLPNNPIEKGYDLADYIIENSKEYLEGKTLHILEDGFLIDKYITELWEKHQGFQKLVTKKGCRLLIQSGTGTGKTTLAENLGKTWFDSSKLPTVIAVPLNAIAQSKHESSKKRGGVTIPYFISKDFHQKNIDASLYDLANAPVMYANFDALEQVCTYLTRLFGGYNLIVDEQHTLITDISFRHQVIEKVILQCEKAQNVILFSGTILSTGFENYQTIEVQKRLAFQRTIQAFELRSENEILACLGDKLLNTDNKCLVLYNSGQKLGLLCQLLTQQGKKVAILKSEEELQFNPAYKSLMQESRFPADIDVLLCTSVVATGIDILNDEKLELHYVNQKWGYDFVLSEQFMARLRHQEKGIFYTYSRENNYSRPFSTQKNFEKLYNAYEKQAKKLPKGSPVLLQNNLPTRTDLDELLQVLVCDEAGEITTNKMKLAYLVHQKHLTTQDVRSIGKHNQLIFCTFARAEQQTILQNLKKNKTEFKMHKEELENKAFHYFNTELVAYAVALVSCTQDKSLKDFLQTNFKTTEKILPQHYFEINNKPIYYLQVEIAENIFGRLMKLAALGIEPSTAIAPVIFNLEKKILLNTATFNIWLTALKINLAKYLTQNTDTSTNVLFTAQQAQHQKIEQSLFEFFETKKQLTNKEIQDSINQHRTDVISKNKAVRYAKSLFDLQTKVCTVKNEKIRFYVFKGKKTLESVLKDRGLKEDYLKYLLEAQEIYWRNCRKLHITNSPYKDDEFMKCSEFEKWYQQEVSLEKKVSFLTKTELESLYLIYEQEIWVKNNPCPF